MTEDGQDAVADHAADPPGGHTEGGHTGDEQDDGGALVPGGISQCQVVRVGAGAVEDLTDQTQDVDGGDDDAAAGQEGPHAVEGIGMLEGSVEYGHLGHKAAQSGKAEVGQTGNDVADRQEGHHFHEAVELAHVTGVGTAVDHTDEGKEEGGHQSVAQHLQHGSGAGGLVHHEQGKEYQSAVRYGGVGVDVFEVGLYAGREGAVHHGDAGEDQENPSQFLGGFGHEVHGDAETSVTAEFHQYAGMEHGYGGGSGRVTVGAPGMEGEEGSQYTESEEGQREPDALLCQRNVVQGGDFLQVHGGGTGPVVDAEDADEQEGGTAHEHQGELHGGIFLAAAAPYTDEQVHGDEGYFIKHKHGEEVGGDEEAEHTQGEQGEPQEVFFGQGLQPPGGEGAGEYNDGREQQHGHGDAVYADGVVDVQGRIPGKVGTEEHVGGLAALAGVEVGYGECDAQGQQGGGTGHHHRTDVCDVPAEPQSEQHQQGDEYI